MTGNQQDRTWVNKILNKEVMEKRKWRRELAYCREDIPTPSGQRVNRKEV